jgi:hypothetical protein
MTTTFVRSDSMMDIVARRRELGAIAGVKVT